MKKRILSYALAIAMTASVMAMPVYADDAETYTITINNETDGHTYTAYQIFAGDLDSEGVLSNIVWGTGVSDTAKSALGDAKTYAESSFDANELATTLVETTGYLGTPAASDNYDDNKYEISGLSSGYYLVTDSSNTDVLSAYIVKVVKDVTATPKTGTPTFEKKVQDYNDSATSPTLSNLQDSADYDIGDSVPFTLTATLPSEGTDGGYSSFKEYYLAFTDDISDGLTNNKDIKVYLNTVAAENLISDDNYTITYGTDDTDDFTLVFDDLKTSVSNAKGGDKIIVTYTATLNESAVIGSSGNPNTAKLTYSRNPNFQGEGTPDTSDTPNDTVIVFTYKVVVDKIDSEHKDLAGAAFTLYKKYTDSNDATGKTEIDINKYSGYSGYYEVGSVEAGEGVTEFTFTGIDDGDYVLVETVTPSGYNTVAPIAFTVSATHTETSDEPALTELTVNNTSLTAVLTNGTITRSDGETSKDVTSGTIYTEVVNEAGATLPETGGMGTTLIYVIGTILVLGAAILLVTKKRMNVEK